MGPFCALTAVSYTHLMPELAELTGIGESTLYDYESGRTSPTLRALEKIAKAMGVRIRDLYTE